MLPTHMKLVDKGVDVPLWFVLFSTPIFKISFIFSLSAKWTVIFGRFFGRWCDVPIPNSSKIEDVVGWIDSLHLTVIKKSAV